MWPYVAAILIGAGVTFIVKIIILMIVDHRSKR